MPERTACRHRVTRPQVASVTDARIARMLSRLSAITCAIIALALFAASPLAIVLAAGARAPAASHSCGRASSASSAGQQAARTRATSPRLTLIPAHGAAGTKIEATGGGWPQGAAVTLTARAQGQVIFSQPAASTTVASDGSFALTFAAPGATCYFAPVVGQVIQVVATAASGNQSASADFTFDVPAPTLSAPPDAGRLDPTARTLPVRGTGWDAGTSVAVWAMTPSMPANAHDPWIPPDGIPVAVLNADAAGMIVGEVPLLDALLPLRPGATLGLAASASGSRYGQMITFLPDAYHVALAAQPSLIAGRIAVTQGDTLRVTGDHWWPGDRLRVLLCQGAPQPTKGSAVRCNLARSMVLGAAQVDATGHFAFIVTVPGTAPTGASTLEVSVSGEPDDPFTATQALRISANASIASWMTEALGPAAPLLALALLALAGVLAACWWVARGRGTPRGAGESMHPAGRR